MGNKNQTFERQTLNNLKEGFRKLLRDNNMYFRTIEVYLKTFDKVFNVKNIIEEYHKDGRSLKITEIKGYVEAYAQEKGIDLLEMEHLKPNNNI